MSTSASPIAAAAAPPQRIEVILGFRPGRDHVPVDPGERFSLRQEASDVVVDRGANGLVILQGVSMMDLVTGLDPVTVN